MKTFWACRVLLFWLAAGGSLSFAQAIGSNSSGGVAISLVPGGRFFRTDVPELTTRKKGRQEVLPEQFACSVQVTNRSASPLLLHYGSAADAQQRILFRILNEEGAEVWTTSIPPQKDEPDARIEVKRKSTLKGNVSIPLKVQGEWLPIGRYTLEAAAGSNGPTATTFFEINTTAPLPLNAGAVLGKFVVLDADGTLTGGSATINLYVPATATPSPGQLAFTTQTDLEGNYLIQVPAGSYRLEVKPGDPRLQRLRYPAGVTLKVLAGDYIRRDVTAPAYPYYQTLVEQVFRAEASILPTTLPSGEKGLHLFAQGYYFDGFHESPRLVYLPNSSPEAAEFDFVFSVNGDGFELGTNVTAETVFRPSPKLKKIIVHGQIRSAIYLVPEEILHLVYP